MFCKSLFGLLSFFFWPLCCLSFDLRILITPLVSSNSSIYGTGDSSSHNKKHLFPFSVCLNVRVVPSLCSFVLFYSVFFGLYFFFIHLFLYSDLSFLANSFGLEFTSFDVLILEIFPWYNVHGTFLFHNVLHTNWWRWQWSWPWFSYSWLLRNCTSLW
jgi:hypothetical protein